MISFYSKCFDVLGTALRGEMGSMGGRLEKEGIYIYLWLIHVVVQQKLTQHYKAIILQFKKNTKTKVFHLSNFFLICMKNINCAIHFLYSSW